MIGHLLKLEVINSSWSYYSECEREKEIKQGLKKRKYLKKRKKMKEKESVRERKREREKKGKI